MMEANLFLENPGKYLLTILVLMFPNLSLSQERLGHESLVNIIQKQRFIAIHFYSFMFN